MCELEYNRLTKCEMWNMPSQSHIKKMTGICRDYSCNLKIDVEMFNVFSFNNNRVTEKFLEK